MPPSAGYVPVSKEASSLPWWVTILFLVGTSRENELAHEATEVDISPMYGAVVSPGVGQGIRYC